MEIQNKLMESLSKIMTIIEEDKLNISEIIHLAEQIKIMAYSNLIQITIDGNKTNLPMSDNS